MKKQKKSGFSLVEVMVAILLLLVLIIGGAAVMYQTGGGIQRQQNKREALIAANFVMETFWNTSFAYLQSQAGTTLPLSDVKDELEFLLGQTISLDVNNIQMEVTATFGPESADANGRIYIDIEVDIDHLGSSDDVVVKTRRYQYGLSRAEL